MSTILGKIVQLLMTLGNVAEINAQLLADGRWGGGGGGGGSESGTLSIRPNTSGLKFRRENMKSNGEPSSVSFSFV